MLGERQRERERERERGCALIKGLYGGDLLLTSSAAAASISFEYMYCEKREAPVIQGSLLDPETYSPYLLHVIPVCHYSMLYTGRKHHR